MNVLNLTIISFSLRKRLVEAGIETLRDLVDLHTSPKRCYEVSHETDIPIQRLHWIISVALFSQINGIGINHSVLLVRIGIDSIEKLAKARGEKVLFDMTQYNRSQPVLHILPSLLVINKWIERPRK